MFRHLFSIVCREPLNIILWPLVQILGPYNSAERDSPGNKDVQRKWTASYKGGSTSERERSLYCLWASRRKLRIQNPHFQPTLAACNQRPLLEPQRNAHPLFNSQPVAVCREPIWTTAERPCPTFEKNNWKETIRSKIPFLILKPYCHLSSSLTPYFTLFCLGYCHSFS